MQIHDDSIRRVTTLFLTSFPKQHRFGRAAVERHVRKLMDRERLAEEHLSHRIREWRKRVSDLAPWELARPAPTPPRDVAFPPRKPVEPQEFPPVPLTHAQRRRAHAGLRFGSLPAVDEVDLEPLTSKKENENLRVAHGMDSPGASSGGGELPAAGQTDLCSGCGQARGAGEWSITGSGPWQSAWCGACLNRRPMLWAEARRVDTAPAQLADGGLQEDAAAGLPSSRHKYEPEAARYACADCGAALDEEVWCVNSNGDRLEYRCLDCSDAWYERNRCTCQKLPAGADDWDDV